ncbi:MAG: acylphosphatase [Gammaproteobacteria bacterium]
MTAGLIGRRIRISGRVQGVGFRYATAERARNLGLGGYARNLPDGQVEILACGTETAVSELVEWVHRGPPMARVHEVAVEHAACEEMPMGFAIR